MTKRGRGRAGRSHTRAPEKVITDPLGALLVAERAAILSGRDDEFVMVTVGFYTGMRFGELVGLETRYARLGSIRVEWQLTEADGGDLLRIPPKDDSYRDVDLPAFLSALISNHVGRANPKPCRCHGKTYVFSAPRGAHWRRGSFGSWVFTPAVSGWFPAKAPYPRRPVPLCRRTVARTYRTG